MSWNHRVVKRTYGKDCNEFAIHEAYSSSRDGKDGMIGGLTEHPVAPAAESLDGLRWILEKMLEALGKPVVDWDHATETRME